MQISSSVKLILAVAAALVLVCAVAPAQDPFAPMPKAGAPAAGGAAPAADPFGGGAPPAGAKTAPVAGLAVPQAQPLPPALQALRDGKPASPADLMQAAQAALQFGRADEARRYLAAVLAAKPADDVAAPLAGQFGEFLFQIARTKEIQPEGQQVADSVLAAAQRVAQNVDRINALIPQLSAAALGDRQEALGKLASGGPAVVTPLLRVLADAGREKEHRYIRAALVHLAVDTEGPLLGALETPNDYLKAQVIGMLGKMGSHRATMHLVRPAVDSQAPAAVREMAAAALQLIMGTVPDRYEAEKYLAQETTRLLRGELPYRPDPDDGVELWTWDEGQRAVVSRKLPKLDAAVLLATRVAGDLAALRPTDNAAQRLMLLTNLELAKVLGGLDRPLPLDAGSAGAAAVAAGPQVMNQVLADAMKQGRIPAAIAAAEVLEKIGDASVLTTSGEPSPLTEALRHPDRRVRLAAALATVKLAPAASFPGASRITETLGWFAATAGGEYVLVGHPRSEDAQTLVGFMNELGFDGQAAYVGKNLVSDAVGNPDIDFILISDAIDLPPARELVQWLRRDYRTANTPVGIMARGERLDDTRFAFAGDPYTAVLPRVHSADVAGREAARLIAVAGRNRVSFDERTAQGRAALAALATLAKTPGNFARHELLRQEAAVTRALSNPALAAGAAEVLALFGSPHAQTALVDFASQNTRPLADRQAAAAAFAAAVQTRGLLLTQSQLAAQFARYNASESEGKDTQALLSSILDTIEAPAIARGELKK